MTLQDWLLIIAAAALLILFTVHIRQTRHLRRAWQQLADKNRELEQLQRNQRNTLQRLPLGACVIDHEQRILFWNDTLKDYTGVGSQECVGKALTTLPSPWEKLLTTFASGHDVSRNAQQLEIDGTPRWYSLHKASLQEDKQAMQVLIVDDETEHQLLSHQLEHQARLASIGRFAAGVAHEIGNPVTAIACLAQDLKLESDQPEIVECSQQIRVQTERITRIVESLIHFAHTGQRGTGIRAENVNLHQCVEDAIHLTCLTPHASTLHLVNQVANDCCCQGDSQQLLQVMINLLGNACDASLEGDTITITSEAHENSVIIRVNDNGSGIVPDHLPHLFEPFYTTKEPGRGTGLGLPLVYNIITDHYGRIEINSPANDKQNKGTQVVITLPRQALPAGGERKQREQQQL